LKNCKNLPSLGASPPDPLLQAAESFAPRPPMASGGWELRPKPPAKLHPLRIPYHVTGINALSKSNNK